MTNAIVVILLLCTAFAPARAGTTGKLAGRITDQNNQPLVGAAVVLVGTTLGAKTDIDGMYTVINIQPGRYEVRVSYIGYRQVTVNNVLVTTNNTTKLDVKLEESTINATEVVITAQKPIVDVNLTSSVTTLTDKDIQALPVQELQDVVNLQAGVVDGHFRGGRIGEVQYQINGVSVNNAYDNSSSLRLDRSLLQEVQVISGTFDAEYGQAMSGVVNAVLKTGSDRFEWNAEAFVGDYFYPGNSHRGAYTARPGGLQSYQLSVSGPVPLPKTYFLVSGRSALTNSSYYAERLFLPTDSSDFEKKIFRPTGDGKAVPLGYTQEYSGLLKVTNKALPGAEIAYQAIVNGTIARREDFNYRLDPGGMPTQHTFSIVHGIDWTQMLNDRTFYTVNARQNYFDYNDYVYRDVNDPRYQRAGAPQSDPAYALGAVIQGVDLGRFVQTTNSFVLKGALTSQMTQAQQVKFGIEYQYSKVEFGSPGYLVPTNINGVQVIRPREKEPPDYPGLLTAYPISASVYGQDQIEWNDLNLRAGLRAEYFDARSTVPSDPANPANAIAGAPLSVPKRTTPKLSIAPRLGVSYPITTTAAVFFAYGHFYQLPGLGQIFTNSDYSILHELQAGGISYGVLGNPNIKPERTVQYEFGYKHQVTDFLGLDVSLFYKDIRDLLGVEFISTYSAAEYARLTNIDFGNVYGFTIALDQRRLGMLSTTLDYTWQMAQGNASDPRETATRAAAGEDPRPRQVPFSWDQRHTLNLTVVLERPGDYLAGAVLKYGSGQPYTPSIGAGFNSGLEANSGTKPAFVLIDARFEKYFTFAGLHMSAFARVFNILDTRFDNGFVFTDTGSPDYSLNPVGDRTQLANPLRYYTPRRIEIGLSLNSL